MLTIPSNQHFHIHWSGQEIVDWQPFDSYADAESAAQDLVRHCETYVIETLNNDMCHTCDHFHARRPSYTEKRYSATD
jgi:hypothetical protein